MLIILLLLYTRFFMVGFAFLISVGSIISIITLFLLLMAIFEYTFISSLNLIDSLTIFVDSIRDLNHDYCNALIVYIVNCLLLVTVSVTCIP